MKLRTRWWVFLHHSKRLHRFGFSIPLIVSTAIEGTLIALYSLLGYLWIHNNGNMKRTIDKRSDNSSDAFLFFVFEVIFLTCCVFDLWSANGLYRLFQNVLDVEALIPAITSYSFRYTSPRRIGIFQLVSMVSLRFNLRVLFLLFFDFGYSDEWILPYSFIL